MKSILFKFLMLTILLSACQSSEKPKIEKQLKKVVTNIYPEEFGASYPKSKIDSLKKLTIEKGDKTAYRLLYVQYAKRYRHGEIFLYSLQMAHKYNHPQAYYDIYYILTEKENTNSIDSLDEQTKNMALYYYTRAHELGLESYSKNDEVFGNKNKIPKSSYYLTKMIEYDSKHK